MKSECSWMNSIHDDVGMMVVMILRMMLMIMLDIMLDMSFITIANKVDQLQQINNLYKVHSIMLKDSLLRYHCLNGRLQGG